MIRPDWDKFIKKTMGCFLQCDCGQILQTMEQVREHWQMGHFDYEEGKVK